MIKYIIAALQENGSNFVADLGLFKKKFFPAEIIDNVLYPSHYKIFLITDDLSENGFEFILFYAQKSNKRINEASQDIIDWTTQLKENLSINKQIDFENFGIFSLDENGKIVFKSHFNNYLNADLEGMTPIYVAPVNETEKNTSAVVNIVADESSHKRRTALSLVLIASFLFIVTSLGYIFYTDLFNLKLTLFHKTDNNIELQTNNTIADEPEIVIADSILEDTDTCNLNVADMEASEKKELTIFSNNKDNIYIDYKEGQYYVIIGSFYTEKIALQHIVNEKLDKLNPKLIRQKGSDRIRICAGVFNSESEAEKYGQSLKIKYWVLK